MKINGIEIEGNTIAYDGCHKIYVCETPGDENMMLGFNAGYEILPIKDIKQVFESSCPLRFISNASLTVHYVIQGENAIFED